MNIARCGHGAYDHGHCAVPDCPNDYRACPDCNPASWPKRKEKEDVWDEYRPNP